MRGRKLERFGIHFKRWYIELALRNTMWGEGKAKKESRHGVQKWGGWYWEMVGRGSVVPFWTCKVEIPIRCNSCCFKTNEWHVIESYGRPVRFLICSNYNEKLERGRE